MKKSLIVTLILVFMLSIAGTAFAAAITNPFVDVPAKHWSYDAIKKLAAAGIIEGADNKFYGDKTLTRYEIAVIVAKALAQEEKADAEQRALIEKLAAEYTAELQSIGVRLSAVEAKADKVQIMGYLGFRYDWEKGAGVQTEAAHLDVTTNYKVDDKTTISLNSLFHQGLRDSSNLDNSSSTNTWTKAAKVVCVNTSIDDKVALTAGAFKFNPAYAMVTSDNDNQGSVVKGLQATFGGDVIKTTLFSGKTTGAYGLFSSNSNGSKYNAAELDFAVSKNTNIKTAYHKTPDVNYYEAGFDTKVAKDLVFTAATAKSDVDVDHN
ncbi:MAG: S-layer y domain protein, partial [Firmicutes bacterium]|nr:S-layer y domain protein [Bacillota bacterium]